MADVELARESLLKVETLREAKADLEQAHEEERLALLPKSVKAKWGALKRRHASELAASNKRLKEVEEECRQRVLELGCTVQGETLQCCYHDPRVAWNTDLLDGMTIAYPSIKDARVAGEATTSIRKMGASS